MKKKTITLSKEVFPTTLLQTANQAFDLFKRTNERGTNLSTAAAALLCSTSAASPSLSTVACEKNRLQHGGTPLGGKHEPTVRCQNAKGLIDSPVLNCVFELISSRYKGRGEEGALQSLFISVVLSILPTRHSGRQPCGNVSVQR